jgi:predicted DNA-binding transcriptional regulator YafY
MQIDRLFGIVYLLLESQHTTANELAVRFEVSKRTILRDIDTLSLAGIPLYTSKGKGGGIFLAEDFVLNKATISEEEQSQILLALQSLGATQYIDVSGTLSKLGGLFGKGDTNWIEVDFSRWGIPTQDNDKFEQLKQAIIKKFALSFSYVSARGERTKRIVYPLKLIFKERSWYLQAWCKDKCGYRTFKISRMLELKLLEENFYDQEFFPPAINPTDSTAPSLIKTKLLFAAEAAYRVYDGFDEQDIQVNQDGSLTVNTELPHDQWLYGYLLSFGTSVQVMAPKVLEDHLRIQVERMYKFYSEENIK